MYGSEINRQRKMQKESNSKRRGQRGSERVFTMEDDFSLMNQITVDEDEETDIGNHCIFCSLELGDNQNMIREFRNRKCCKFCFSDATLVVNGGSVSNIKTSKKRVDGVMTRFFVLSNGETMPI